MKLSLSAAAVLFSIFLLLQCFESEGWWWRRRRRCKHPNSSRYSTQYYYGSTSLFKGKKRVFKWSLKHSLILFRGKIFEWGLGRPKTYKMNRSPSDCKIKWTWSSKGSSRCRLSDAETWTRNYRRRYGGYRLFTNNCHYFVNRFMSYLRSNCGR